MGYYIFNSDFQVQKVSQAESENFICKINNNEGHTYISLFSLMRPNESIGPMLGPDSILSLNFLSEDGFVVFYDDWETNNYVDNNIDDLEQALTEFTHWCYQYNFPIKQIPKIDHFRRRFFPELYQKNFSQYLYAI